MNGAELFVDCLENEGVEVVFGLPGEEIEDLLFALKSSNIKLVITRHEQGAAFMADVYGRITGKAGVCLSTLGPGATNLVTGIADANLDHSPLVAITGQGNIDRLHKESHQIIDIVNMFHPITKWNARINSPDVIPEIVRKAFKIAEIEKPGATHIEFSEDVAAHEVSKLSPLRKTKIRRPSSDHKAIAEAVSLINSAKKPLILAGNGSIRKLASSQLQNLVKKTNIPVISTFMGKGAVPDDWGQSLFAVGLGTQELIYEVIDSSDLLISVGYDIAEFDPKKLVKTPKKIIHIDFTYSEVYSNYQPDVEIVSDISNALWQINQGVNKKFEFKEAEKARKILEDQWKYYKKSNSKITPKGLLYALRSHLKFDDIIISDVGAHKMWIGSHYPTFKRNSVIISNGFASMGIAVPGAIGAKIAKPERRIVAVTGDGGFLMNSQELETAKRLKIPFVVIIWNDQSYGLIEWKQKTNKNQSFGTDLGKMDFVSYAKSFGLNGIKVETETELSRALDYALTYEETFIIDAIVNGKENASLFKG